MQGDSNESGQRKACPGLTKESHELKRKQNDSRLLRTASGNHHPDEPLLPDPFSRTRVYCGLCRSSIRSKPPAGCLNPRLGFMRGDTRIEVCSEISFPN